jgi:hypothetical protein
MEILHSAIMEAIEGLPNQFLAQLVTSKLAAQGVHLSAGERKQLDRYIKQRGKDAFRIKRWKFWDRQQTKVEFSPGEIEQAEHKFTDFIESRMPDLIQGVAGEVSNSILRDLKRKWRAESRRQEREFSGFAKRLQKRWGAPIEGLRMLLTISRELGAIVNDRIRNSPESTDKNLVEVLTRSHARACQITEEIICLMTSGFADGAMARWRTLHEVAITAIFVSEHGEQLAERYVLHQSVESKRAADEYARYRARLGVEPLDAADVESVEKDFAALRTRFGKDFVNRYGWAAQHLRMRDPSINDVERAVGIDHLRPLTIGWRHITFTQIQKALSSS